MFHKFKVTIFSLLFWLPSFLVSSNAQSVEYQLVYEAICTKDLRDSNDPVAQFLETGLVSEDEFVSASLDAFGKCPSVGNNWKQRQFI